jgi:hypothetical protein
MPPIVSPELASLRVGQGMRELLESAQESCVQLTDAGTAVIRQTQALHPAVLHVLMALNEVSTTAQRVRLLRLQQRLRAGN